MTARQMFEAMLVELNNTSSPSLLLDDYNYFINKAIDMYINKRYTNYDTTQQTTDDLRVLKSTAILPVNKKVFTDENTDEHSEKLTELMELIKQDKSFEAMAEVILPSDYMHTLNCICIYKVKQQTGCYDESDVAKYAAKRLTADSWSTVMNDYYNRPTPRMPYYYIHNINTQTELPTNPLNDKEGETYGTDPWDLRKSFTELEKQYADYIEASITNHTFQQPTEETGFVLKNGAGNLCKVVQLDNGAFNFVTVDSVNDATKYSRARIYDTFDVHSAVYNSNVPGSYSVGSYIKTINKNDYAKDFPKQIKIGGKLIGVKNVNTSVVEKTAGVRYGNASKVRMEIRYGQSDVFELKGVAIDYIKAPQHIRLTKNQMDLTEDRSQIIEFPDYVCQEIINQLVALVMANNADPRIQTTVPLSQSIVDPAQQQAQQARRQASQQA